MKCKYKDNIEFVQWMKKFYDHNIKKVDADYNPEKRRRNIVPDFSAIDLIAPGKAKVKDSSPR